MKIALSGKRGAVTGSTSGIGFAIIRGLAEGARRSQLARRLHEHVPQAKVEGIAADLANAAGVAAFVARVGAVDIPVKNLGIVKHMPERALNRLGGQN